MAETARFVLCIIYYWGEQIVEDKMEWDM